MSLRNSCGFQEGQGFSLFPLLSPLYLCSVRTRCSAHQRDNQSCDPFQGELSSRWKEKQNKQEGKRWEIRSINPYLCFFVDGIYLLTLARVANTFAHILPIFHPTSLTTVSHHPTDLLHSLSPWLFQDSPIDFQTELLPLPQCFLLLTPRPACSTPFPDHCWFPPQLCYFLQDCLMNNSPDSLLPANEDGERFTSSLIAPWAISQSKRNYDTKIGPWCAHSFFFCDWEWLPPGECFLCYPPSALNSLPSDQLVFVGQGAHALHKWERG